MSKIGYDPERIWHCDNCKATNHRAVDMTCYYCGQITRPQWQNYPYNELVREIDEQLAIETLRPMIVACINLYKDLDILKANAQSWIRKVDAMHIVYGGYDPANKSLLPMPGQIREKLQTEMPMTVSYIWGPQYEKRSEYLRTLQHNEIAFVIDADEWVENPELIHTMKHIPETYDVGWVWIHNPTYRRPYKQPRFFTMQGARYAGRHHFVVDSEERLIATHQYGGVGYRHIMSRLKIVNTKPRGRSIQVPGVREKQEEMEAGVFIPPISGDRLDGPREALNMVHLCGQDFGGVAFRLNDAINTTTPHNCILGRTGGTNPYEFPTGAELPEKRRELEIAILKADVVHHHSYEHSIDGQEIPRGRWNVLHHHGSMLRDRQRQTWLLKDRYDLELVSNFELLGYGAWRRWLPNPMPVPRYKAMRVKPPIDHFQVCHSPTNRDKKGTNAFIAVVTHLEKKGYDISWSVIENRAHRQALEMKRGCHVFFDSFWLGIQCSGLEAAAMGVAVVAGDPHVAGFYEDMLGRTPYTYADDADMLEDTLMTLYNDSGFLIKEAETVHNYVLKYHDYPAVALRYLDLLDQATHWREALTIKIQEGGIE